MDAFNEGEILFPQDCAERLAQVYGQPVQMRPEFLQAVGPKQFLARMLTNLKAIYLNRGENSKALEAIEKILLLFPEAVVERRDRGVLYYQLGRWIEARQDLESYLVNIPNARDAEVVRGLLLKISLGL